MSDTPSPLSAPWSRGKLFAFRATFAFFVPILTVSWTYLAPPRVSGQLESFGGFLPACNEALGRWAMANVLRLPPHSAGSGPGHPLTPFILLGVLAVISVAAAAVWSLLHPQAESPAGAWNWLHTAARYSLAAAMLGYGFAKVFPVQFGETVAGPELTQPVGQMTPNGLLWLFMGTSRTYAGFAGAIECLAGVLLLARRTAGLGALVALGALVNVGMLDIAYGVPVLHVVTVLVLLAIVIAVPTLPRAMAALIGSGPIRAPEPMRLFLNARHDLRARTAGALIGGLLVIGHAIHAQREVAARREMSPPRLLRGVWQAEVARDGRHAEEATQADTSAWRYFGFILRDRAMIRQRSGHTVYFDAVVDTMASTLLVTRRRGPTATDTSRYRYSLEGGERLLLVPQDVTGGRPITLHRLAPSEFRLTTAHAAWVW